MTGPELYAPPPVPLPGPEEEVPDGVFGTADPLRDRVFPVPNVSLGGVLIATARAGDGSLTTPLAVEELSWEWGRTDVLDQPAPGTARLILFCPDPAWFRARAGSLIGSTVDIGYTVTGVDGPSSRDTKPFRGRVVDAQAELVTLGGVRGLRLELAAAHRLTELGNRRLPSVAPWPVESTAARVVRVNTYISAVLGMGMRSYFDATQMAVVNPADTDALSIMRKMFDTTGADRMIYVPDINQCHPVNRRAYGSGSGLGRLTTVTGPRYGKVIVSSFGISNPGSTFTSGPPAYLDGRVVEMLSPPTADISSRVTRVELGYVDNSTGNQTVTKLVPGTDEALEGRRTLSVDTLHTTAAWADQTAGDWASMLAVEARAWKLGDLRWDTANTGGGFDTLDQVDLLLVGYERGSYFHLSSTELHEYGINPFFGAMGGKIRYRKGRWIVEIHPAPASDETAMPSIQLRHLAAPGFDFPMSQFDESVTLADLGRVSRGYGQTVTYLEGTP